MRRLNYGGMIVLTTPFLGLAILVGLIGMILDSDDDLALLVARPFLWAKDRKV
jgi:hypothetical protein